MTATTDKPSTETCKSALCAEISKKLGVDLANVSYAPNFTPAAQAEFDRLCTGVCDTCPVLDVAAAMRATRLSERSQ